MKKRILVSFYGEVQGYPPTINMLNVLIEKGFDVILLCRNSDGLPKLINGVIEIHDVYGSVSIEKQMYGSPLLKTKLYFTFFLNYIKLRIISKPHIILLYDPIAIVIHAFSVNFFKKRKIWYHNHDILESTNKKMSTNNLLRLIEKKMINRIDYLTLPALERLKYFNTKEANLTFGVIPNFPSKNLFLDFFSNRANCLDDFHLLFQGSIGEGHGLEQFITVLGWNKSINSHIYLNLKGKINNDYKSKLISLAKKKQVNEYLIFHEYTDYSKVPELASKCHLGIAVFTKDDIMNSTLGTASNKIYEYAATGMPIVYYKNEHFEEHLGQMVWAFGTSLDREEIKEIIRKVKLDFKKYSLSAYSSFVNQNNFESYANEFVKLIN